MSELQMSEVQISEVQRSVVHTSEVQRSLVHIGVSCQVVRSVKGVSLEYLTILMFKEFTQKYQKPEWVISIHLLYAVVLVVIFNMYSSAVSQS